MTAAGGLGSLKKIREQIQNRKNEQELPEQLSEDKLEIVWLEFQEKLAENNQVTSHSNFRMASIKIIDDLVFEIQVGSKIQLQFIEAERTLLLMFRNASTTQGYNSGLTLKRKRNQPQQNLN
jgi:hypothetical protein